MKLRLVIATVACLFVSLHSASAQDRNDFIAMGFGASTCTQFADLYKVSRRWGETQYFIWAQGFMSGWNMAQSVEKKPNVNLTAMSIAEQKQHIRSYCDRHALGDFSDAVLDLIATLRTQANPK